MNLPKFKIRPIYGYISYFFMLLLVLCVSISSSFAATESLVSGGTYYIVSQSSLKAMAAHSNDGVLAIQQNTLSRQDDAQKWTLIQSGNSYVLKSKKYNLYLSINNEQLSLTGAKSLWKITPWQDAFLIGNEHDELNINLFGSKKENGAQIGVRSFETGENSQWLLIAEKDIVEPSQSASLRPQQSNFALDSKTYTLEPLPAGASEATRLNRLKPADYQPSGLYLRKGETVCIETNGVERLSVLIGPPLVSFSQGLSQNIVTLAPTQGAQSFKAPADGMMYFRYVAYDFLKAPEPAVVKVLEGGTRVPLYIAGRTSLSDWQKMLTDYKDAPFVEMVSGRVMITVKRSLYNRSVKADPKIILALTDSIINAYDDLSGLDTNKPTIDQSSPLRIHYLQDDFSPPKELENVYMYAMDYVIAMPNETALDILDPKTLASAWSIWHETGHHYQQDDWTTDYAVETTVNIYSLYFQSKSGQPSRLDDRNDNETGKSYRQLATAYLQQANRDFSNETNFPDGNAVWVRLVMFDQLRQVLGNDFYRELHTYYRHHPLTADETSDQKKMDIFAYRASLVSGFDLTEYFDHWGLRLSPQAKSQIKSLKNPQPDQALMNLK